MSSIPYSRYILYPVTWYSFLIFIGAVIAVFLAVREEKRSSLPHDTVIDLSLRILPLGIIGARLYYVVFSWDRFRNNPLSILKIWEGGLAIYGGVIAGIVVLFFFARRRHLPVLQLCDLVAPGLALAQSIGRWGNWFNMEAYGLKTLNPSLCFFPIAVQIPSDGNSWHLATFFYESLWDLAIFLFLFLFLRKHHKKTGDVFFFYLFLYGCGRLIIEELRLDSLFASSDVRISQLLSVLLCIAVLIRYVYFAGIRMICSSPVRLILLSASGVFSVFTLLFVFSASFMLSLNTLQTVLMLVLFSLLMILCLFSVYWGRMSPEVHNANQQN